MIDILNIKEQLLQKGIAIIDSGLIEESHIINLQQQICAKIGRLREHNIGKEDYLWPIKLQQNNSAITTFSEHNDEAELHTDSQYSHIAEKYMSLSCINPAACGGGINFFLDINNLFPALKANHLVFSTLQQDFPIAIPDIFNTENKHILYKPIIAKSPLFRYRYDTMKKGLLNTNMPLTDNKWLALNFLKNLIDKSPFKHYYTLSKGQIIIIDNHRIMHGRTAFQDTNRLLYRIRMDEF